MEWPETLAINAWTGDAAAASPVNARTLAWVLQTPPLRAQQYLAPPPEADPANWRDPRVGWGVVLAEKPGLSKQDLASGADAPEPIRKLIRERGNAPVFRYAPVSSVRSTFLHNYRTGKSIAVDPGSPQGLGEDAIPAYLLIYGSPHEVPWEFQYLLNATCAAGRLDLEGEALERYVDALLSNWAGSAAKIDHATVWAVDDNDGITPLMRDAIAQNVADTLAADSDLAGKVQFLDGRQHEATAAALVASLAANAPGLVVTTSHGMTGPLDDPGLMRAQMGLPVDGDRQVVDPETLLAAWQPNGAIWYAHACCSAGADDHTTFDGLLPAGSAIDTVLKAVASVGPLVSPLPRALLGAPKPLRAFIGHVEPTFDWTLRQTETQQHLTEPIRRALYNHLYGNAAKPPDPVGLAFRDLYLRLAALYVRYEDAKRRFQATGGSDFQHAMLYCQLTSADVKSMVILGDPTAVLPPLA